MKKLTMLCVIVLMYSAGSAMAQPNYQFAEAGTKNVITETNIGAGTQISLDLWLQDAGATPQISGGAWIDFTGSTTKISYVSGGRALTDGSEGPTGNWTPGAGVYLNEPDGVGTVMYVCVNLSGSAPDVDGDQFVGTVTLRCTAGGDAIVNLITIPGVPTWGPIVDADAVPGSLIIRQQVQTTTSIPIIVQLQQNDKQLPQP